MEEPFPKDKDNATINPMFISKEKQGMSSQNSGVPSANPALNSSSNENIENGGCQRPTPVIIKNRIDFCEIRRKPT